MHKLTKLVTGLLMLTLLTGCEVNLHGEEGRNPEDPSSGENQNGQQNGQSGGQEYNDGGQSNGEQSSGNEDQPSDEQASGNEDQSGNEQTQTDVNTVSVSVEDLADIYDWESGKQYSSFNLDSKVSVSSSGTPYGKSSTTNTGKYYDSDATYRLYGNEHAKLTFEVPEGQAICGIKLSFEGGTFEEQLQSNVEKEFDSNKVVLNVTYVNSGALKISNFEVKYTGEKGTPLAHRTNWTEEELALIKQYAYGINVPYYHMSGNTLDVQDGNNGNKYLYITGAMVTLDEMEEYAALFRADSNWEELSDPTDINDLYFESHITVDGQERYVRANMYVDDYYYELVTDPEEVAYFNLTLADPYYYEWPTEVVAYVAELVGSTSTISAISSASRVEIAQSDDYQYVIMSYDQTQTQFNSYVESLGATFDVTEGEDELEGFKIAIPKALDDIELWLVFDAQEGAIYIYVNKHLPHLSEFPQTQVKARNGDNDIPVPEGATYFTYDEEYQQYFDYETYEIKEEYAQSIVIAYGLDSTEMTAYLNNKFGVNNWEVTLVAVDDKDNPTMGQYVAQLFKEDGKYYEFVMVYDMTNEMLEMAIYPVEGYKYSTSYPETVIKSFLTANSLGTIPSLELTGVTHYIYVENENYVWVFVQGNYEQEWLDILEANGYVIPKEPHEEYGYECRSKDDTIEIDVHFDEDYGQTGFTIYSTEYLESQSEDDWGDFDWDTLFGD